MIVSALSPELDWNPTVRPGEGRVVARWGGLVVYAWTVTDRQAAWLSEEANLQVWFAGKLTELFEHVFGTMAEPGSRVTVEQPAPPGDGMEQHVCAWEYVPYMHEGLETPEWRCAKRWSDGQRCTARRAVSPTGREEMRRYVPPQP